MPASQRITWTYAQDAISVQLKNGTKTYGDTDPKFDAPTLPSWLVQPTAGWVAADFKRVDKPGNDSQNVTAKDSQGYEITLSDAGLKKLQDANPNYTIAATDIVIGHLTVTPKKIKITAADKEKIYGTVDPTLTVNKITGLVGTDTITPVITRAAGEEVGTYTITPSAAADQNANYEVTFVTGKLTIKPIPVRSILVNYVVEGTNRVIHGVTTQAGNEGTDYTVTPLEISGYTYHRATPGQLSGRYGAKNLEYTLYYTVNYTVVPKTPDGQTIPGVPPVSGTGVPGDPINNLPEIPGYRRVTTVTPGIPGQPGVVTVVYEKIPDQPGQPGVPGQPGSDGNVTPTNTGVGDPTGSNTTPSRMAKQLPHTGEEDQTAVTGLGLSTLVGLLGLLGFKRKNRKHEDD